MDSSLFSVKPSTIFKAGKGLFTKVDIPQNTTVLHYLGKKQPYHSHKNHNYCFGLDNNTCINALKSSHIAKYVNDNHNYTDKQLNLKWVFKDDQVLMVSIKDIPKNSELFIPYGDKYWS